MGMRFREFLETRQELATAFKSKLHGVPQDPDHHPEGDVLIHTRLVRKAIPKAIQELQSAQAGPLRNVLAGMNFSLSPEEVKIISMAAWIHDIGKQTATTIDGNPWRQGGTGKIQAIGHQDPEHFLPQLQDLEGVAPEETKQLYVKNKELLDWLVSHHMDFASGQGFSKNFVAENFDGERVKPTQQMKLLLILMWSDKMGRRPEDTIARAVQKNTQNLLRSSERSGKRAANIARQSVSFGGGPEEFAQILKGRSMAANQRYQAMRGKFPDLPDEEIRRLTEGADNVNPTIVKSEIHIPEECIVVARALTKGYSNTEVYAVGGSVRDHLFGKQPKDFDLTCNLSEKEIVERLRRAGLKVAEKESDTFGVVFVHVTDGQEPIEVAPFRTDVGIADGRRPEEVQFGVPIDQDALRRDFTMNSLYYDFGFGRYGAGSIIDFNPGGQGIKDIKDGVVRPVGVPSDRFREDRFRILRLMRFFSRYNGGDISTFIDDATKQAIDKYGDLRRPVDGLAPISDERIQSEFLAGIKQSKTTSEFLKNYVRLGLMQNVFPNLMVDTQGIDRLGNSKNPNVVLAWLLRKNPNAGQALNRLKWPNEITDSVQFLIESLKFGADNVFAMVKRRDRNAEMSAALKRDLQEFAQLVGDPQITPRLSHFAQYNMPVVSGEELMSRGLKGKEIGDEQRRQATAHYSTSFGDFMRSQDEKKKPLSQSPISQTN